MKNPANLYQSRTPPVSVVMRSRVREIISAGLSMPDWRSILSEREYHESVSSERLCALSSAPLPPSIVPVCVSDIDSIGRSVQDSMSAILSWIRVVSENSLDR